MDIDIIKKAILKEQQKEFKPAPLEDSEKKTWLNYWSEELWELKHEKYQKYDITPYITSLIELSYDGKYKDDLNNLYEMIDPAFTGKQKFIRTNRRSPKDYTGGNPISRTEKAIEALTCSMRVVDDLGYLKMHNEPAYLYIFDFHSIIQQKEFRCFVKDKKFIAISQYEGTKIKGFPEDDPNNVIVSIQELFPKLNNVVPLDDYVFDVYIYFNRNTGKEEARFLEINPYGESDPCFFKSYEEVERGGFAYQKTTIEEFY